MHANFPSRQTNININFWVGGGGSGVGKVLFDVLGKSVQCDPRTLNFYNSISTTSNSTAVNLFFNVCATETNEKP